MEPRGFEPLTSAVQSQSKICRCLPSRARITHSRVLFCLVKSVRLSPAVVTYRFHCCRAAATRHLPGRPRHAGTSRGPAHRERARSGRARHPGSHGFPPAPPRHLRPIEAGLRPRGIARKGRGPSEDTSTVRLRGTTSAGPGRRPIGPAPGSSLIASFVPPPREPGSLSVARVRAACHFAVEGVSRPTRFAEGIAEGFLEGFVARNLAWPLPGYPPRSHP